MGRLPVNDKVLIGALFLGCLIPTTAGTYRALTILTSNNWAFEWAADHVDYVPLLFHVVASVVFLCIAAGQMVPGLRVRFMRWHRRAGRVAAVAGAIGALSGIWLTLAHPGISGPVLYFGRLGASTFWLISVILAVHFVMTHRVDLHRAWMIRAFAMALPAGTLAFILIPFIVVFGEEGNATLLEAVQAGSWPFHLLVAEWFIRRKSAHRTGATAKLQNA